MRVGFIGIASMGRGGGRSALGRGTEWKAAFLGGLGGLLRVAWSAPWRLRTSASWARISAAVILGSISSVLHKLTNVNVLRTLPFLS
jgi:hypothetical protein